MWWTSVPKVPGSHPAYSTLYLYTYLHVQVSLRGHGSVTSGWGIKVGGGLTASLLGLPSLTPSSGPELAVVICNWELPIGLHLAVALLQVVDNWQMNSGNRFSTGGLLAMASLYSFTLISLKNNFTTQQIRSHFPLALMTSQAVCVICNSVGAGVWSVGGAVTGVWRGSVSLQCHAVGHPTPTLHWTHDGRLLHSTDSRCVPFCHSYR